MVRILGFFIPGKEERRKRDEEVLRHYFVYGAKHRDKVGELLEELIPGEKREHLLLYYLQIKDAMEACGLQDFDEAVTRMPSKSRIITVNKTVHQYYKAVMEADAGMDEDLVLPSADEIRKSVEQSF